jgi:hypothetical protein
MRVFAVVVLNGDAIISAIGCCRSSRTHCCTSVLLWLASRRRAQPKAIAKSKVKLAARRLHVPVGVIDGSECDANVAGIAKLAGSKRLFERERQT